MIREVKTFHVGCDWCDNKVVVHVPGDDPDCRDAAVEAGELGWRKRGYSWDLEILCPNHNPDDDVTMGSGWEVSW